MEAIVLAGGFGTRLSHIVSNVPKPMAPVAGRPFLEYILDYLARQGITRVVLATGYMHEIVQKHFKNSYRNMNIIYSVEDKPLGTGGAIKLALPYCDDNNILVLNGDTYFSINLTVMKQFHEGNNCDITIAAKLMYNYDRYGTLVHDQNRIVGFKEKQFMVEGLINTGTYIMARNLLNDMPDIFSLESEFLERYVNEKIMGLFQGNGYFVDIGIEEDYVKANMEEIFYVKDI